MSIAWLAPAALFGAALVVLPIAVHLLVRQHARVQAFPSLRFLRETQLAALRRRRIEDAALLSCRLGIIAAATLALAGPVIITPARTASHAGRTSRAVIVSDQSAVAQAADAAGGAFRSVTITRAVVGDAIADALRWLHEQPPSAMEIVVIGGLPRGAVTAGDVAAVPRDVGVRFVRSGSATRPDLTIPMLARRDGALMRVDRAARLSTDATLVTTGDAVSVPKDLVSIAAGNSDSPLAAAALAAALDAGVPWRDFEHRVLVVWDGAAEAQVTARSAGARVIRMARPTPDAAAADAVRNVLARASRPALVDPVPISNEQLAAWSRPPGSPSPAAPLGDEGDRRWVWAIALALLGLEWWLRERRAKRVDVHAGRVSEARVA